MPGTPQEFQMITLVIQPANRVLAELRTVVMLVKFLLVIQKTGVTFQEYIK